MITDEQIAALITERKDIPDGLRPMTKMSEWYQHKRKSFEISTESGNEFVIAVRQSCLSVYDFSVILGYKLPRLYTVFRLRRYNGSSHQHTNILERETINGFHIYKATERYQRLTGSKEDHFAEKTDRYYHLESAIECLLVDCGFRSPLDSAPLFMGQP